MDYIGIVTLNGYLNYGNRLQNYAVQELIGHYGFHAETLVAKPTINTLKSTTKKAFLNRKIIKRFIYSLIERDCTGGRRQLVNDRVALFKSFSKKYIREIDYDFSDVSAVEGMNKKYAFFVAGSDQIWNPNFPEFSPVNFLQFAKRSKRVALSPSFGVSELDISIKNRVSEWIQNIPYLSVREVSGANIIYELTGRVVPVLVDPTMMLTKEDWLDLSSESNEKPNGKYILTYFLGKKGQKEIRIIHELARFLNATVVNLNDVYCHRYYTTSPSEFIDYINDASCVITDSFHGSIFSIIMQTPFIVFQRGMGKTSMNSRIETLLSSFQLRSLQYTCDINIKKVLDVDLSHVKPRIQEEKKKTHHFLQEAFYGVM